MKLKLKVLSMFFFSVLINNVFAQEIKELNAAQVAELAVENHQELKVSEKNIEAAKQQIQVTKLEKLPNIEVSTKQFYLGNALLIDKDFSSSESIELPHYGASYALEASQLLFKGGLVNKSIELAGIKEQLAELDLENDQQAVKFLVISNYLDIYKLINQEKVFQNNKALAVQRLKNIKKFYDQGMITRNEVIRAELAIKSLDQGILTLNNNKKILNYNLDLAIGFPENVEIKPTENLAVDEKGIDKDYYINLSHTSHPLVKTARANNELANKNLEIINTEKSPTIAAFGGYSSQKPIMNTMPVINSYLNGWQVGLSLSYSLDNLYKAKKKEQVGEIAISKANEVEKMTLQNIDMAVNAAYVKYQEAIDQAEIMKESQKLADENYKITEAKYLNQLAVQTEMIDAQNQKLQAELDYANAEITVLYQYYNLLKSTGTL